jgi:hypothetical protein
VSNADKQPLSKIWTTFSNNGHAKCQDETRG